MVKLTNAKALNEEFSQEIMRMAEVKFTNWEDSYNLSKLIRKLRTELSHVNEARLSLLKKYAFLEPDGKFTPNKIKKEDGTEEIIPNTFSIIPEKMDEYVKELQNFLEGEIEIQVKPLSTCAISDANFSANQLELMECIFDLPVDITEQKQ